MTEACLSRRCLEPIDTLVLAGGLGSRLRPVIGDIPKLLASIAGRPFLAYLLKWLGTFGARRVVLALGHRAQAVIDHLQANPCSSITVVPVIEPEPFGTAGALRFARAELRTDPVLVMNGDTLADVDLCTLLSRHARAAKRATVLCAEVADASRYGRVILDQNGDIAGFVEKDTSYRGAGAINAGVYVMTAAFLDEIADGEATSLERDVFERLPAGSLAALAARFNFIDIGTPESLVSARDVFPAYLQT